MPDAEYVGDGRLDGQGADGEQRASDRDAQPQGNLLFQPPKGIYTCTEMQENMWARLRESSMHQGTSHAA